MSGHDTGYQGLEELEARRPAQQEFVERRSNDPWSVQFRAAYELAKQAIEAEDLSEVLRDVDAAMLAAMRIGNRVLAGDIAVAAFQRHCTRMATRAVK